MQGGFIPRFCYAHNFEKVGDILVSACPCVCVCMCVCVSHYRFEIRQNSVKSTVRSEIDHFRCEIWSGW